MLLVDDDEDDYVLIRELLADVEGQRYAVDWTATYEDALQTMAAGRHDVCLVDYHLGQHDGMELLREAVARGCSAPIILLTGAGSNRVDREAIRAGAADYLLKARLDGAQLERSIRYALERAQILGELRDAQAHLVQSEKMASLGQLVAGIAHEINNPLTFVLSNIHTVKERIAKALEEAGDALPGPAARRLERSRILLGDMQDGTERVRNLVLKLRTFSRLEEGEFKKVDIHESIDSALLFLQHKTKGRIEIRKNYGPVSQLACYAGELNQVLVNVIANAVEAIEGEGTVTIGTWQEDGWFVVSVKDTGPGIPEAIRERIFEPFFTTKAAGHGTGLGLAITRNIVEAHQGRIEVHTRRGTGTEIVIRIPTDLQSRIDHDRTDERDQDPDGG
ncbi:MAG: ATP-binding protein [Candidatus Latescibacterota bacterium]